MVAARDAMDATVAAPRERVAVAVRRCEAAGVPLTPPRRVVLDIVVGLESHPSADEVFAEATRRVPGIGRATVYRALERFVHAGVISKVAHPGPTIRYDGTIEQHHHVVCLRCNRIVDFTDPSLDTLRVPDTLRHEFTVSDVQVVLRGICKACQEAADEPMTSRWRTSC